jgi:response regulator of citrate/malate metabolism
MIKLRTGNAAEFLAHHSDLVYGRSRLPAVSDVLIVGEPASPLLGSMVRLMFGYDVSVRTASSLGAMLDAISVRFPDLIFLDEAVSPNLKAVEAIPIIRRCGYAGPVLITAIAPSTTLIRALLDAGVADVIDRDELDSARIAEALLGAHLPDAVAAE